MLLIMRYLFVFFIIMLGSCSMFMNRGAPTSTYFTVNDKEYYTVFSGDNMEVTLQPFVYRNFPDSLDAVDVLTLSFSFYNNSCDTLSVLATDLKVMIKKEGVDSLSENIILKEIVGEILPFSNQSIQENLPFKMFQQPWTLGNSVLMVENGTLQINGVLYPISKLKFNCEVN